VPAGPAEYGTFAGESVPTSSDRSRIQPKGTAAGLPWFEVREVVDGSGHTLVLSGELDMVSSADLEAAISLLCKEGTSRLVLDLSQLAFMDLMGLRMVLFAKELCEWHRCEFALVPGPVSVQRVFELTNLLDVMPFESQCESAAPQVRSSSSHR
jgi:anti-anti-sigma factor